MSAKKWSQTTAIGRGRARLIRIVLAAGALAAISAAATSWSLANASTRPSSTVVTVASAPAGKAFEDPGLMTMSQAEPGVWAQPSRNRANPPVTLQRPHVLATEVADVLVRIRGGAVCTGTPITGTTFVVTAAHCVLDGDGEVSTARTVVREGVEYIAVSVLVNPEYHDAPNPRLDAAVLVMEQAIPGPSAELGDVLPTQGPVILAGFQPLDSDGSLLRGTRYDNRPRPQSATGGVVKLETAAAGCVHPVSELEITDTQVNVPCGLIPGASGGGLFVERNGDFILVGIISTVAFDLTSNGIVPLAPLHELLDNPDEYTHEIAAVATTFTRSNVVRS